MLCDLGSAREPLGFCCLGVAADMAKVKYRDYPEDSRRRYATTGDGDLFGSYEGLVLPPEAQEWLGVTSEDPPLGFDPDNNEHHIVLSATIGHEAYDLLDNPTLTPAGLNDAGLTFAQIADVIEQFGFNRSYDQLESAA